MVKMPSLDDLKKVGAGLVDSAKSGKINEMMDKVKSGMGTVSAGMKKEAAPVVLGDDVIKNQFQAIYASLAELTQTQTAQTALIRKVESQLSSLAKTVEASSAQQAAPAVSSTVEPQTIKEEEKKD